MARILVLHGPNLNLLGTREPEIYGHESLKSIDQALHTEAKTLGHTLTCFQSNHEGPLVDHIQDSVGSHDLIVLNAAAYTHTSVAIRDAIQAVSASVPTVEVHLSIPGAREAFRRTHLLDGVVAGRIEGFGSMSYVLALRAASGLLAERG